MSTTRRWKIRGRVQGVGFRYFARREAEFLGLTGSVRNLEDGGVEVLGQGSEEALDRFAEQLTRGPSAGRVDELIEERIETPNPASEDSTHPEFRILF